MEKENNINIEKDKVIFDTKKKTSALDKKVKDSDKTNDSEIKENTVGNLIVEWRPPAGQKQIQKQSQTINKVGNLIVQWRPPQGSRHVD